MKWNEINTAENETSSAHFLHQISFYACLIYFNTHQSLNIHLLAYEEKKPMTLNNCIALSLLFCSSQINYNQNDIVLMIFSEYEMKLRHQNSHSYLFRSPWFGFSTKQKPNQQCQINNRFGKDEKTIIDSVKSALDTIRFFKKKRWNTMFELWYRLEI